MRTLACVAVLSSLLAAACGSSSVDLAPTEVTTPTTESVSASTTTTTAPPTTTTTPTTTSTTTSSTTTIPDVPPELVLDDRGVPTNGQTDGVLITETGWVTPVLSGLAGGRHRVWTPCGRTQDIAGGRFVGSVDFVLDPGHGGSEPGAVGRGGLREADLNLDVTLKLRNALVDAGYSVMMTRQTDVRVPIVTRAEIAQALDPIAFISVHFNAGTDAVSATPGTEMYHQIDSPDSKRLAGLIYEESFGVLDQFDIRWVALGDAGTLVRPNREGGDYYGGRGAARLGASGPTDACRRNRDGDRAVLDHRRSWLWFHRRPDLPRVRAVGCGSDHQLHGSTARVRWVARIVGHSPAVFAIREMPGAEQHPRCLVASDR